MLGVITGLLDLIPQVGATIAAVILVAVALTVGTTEAVIMAVIQLIYQQVENYIIYPIVYRQAVELSPFTTIVAVLIASSILGVVGAILAVPFAAVIKTVLREAGAPRRERMAALRESRDRLALQLLLDPRELGDSARRSAAASSWFSATARLALRIETTMLVTSGIMLTPVIISTVPTSRPCGVTGTMSP